MTISSFSNKDHFQKVLLVECQPVYLISTIPGTWTVDGNAYYKTFTDCEFIDILEDNTSLTAKNNVADCKANASSYFQDFANGRIYIHTSGSDSPTNYYYTGTFWTGFTNYQDVDYKVIFSPQTATKPIYYNAFLKMGSIPSLSQTLGDYYTTAIVTQVSGVSFLGSGWFYERRYHYIWHNRPVVIKLGYVGAAYGSYEVIYEGITKNIDYSDKTVKIGIKDKRAKDLGEIPVDVYKLVSHPGINAQTVGKPIQIVFGQKENVVGVNVDGYGYLFSDTIFNGNTYALEAVSAVYVDGVRIYVTTNYTVNLSTGIVTLLNDPGDSIVTADIKGIKCQFDFTVSGGGTATGVWTENTADILFFLLKELNQIPVADIDISTFDDLQTKRTQKVGFVLDKIVNTREVIRTLQQSCQFHLFPTNEGEYQVKYYDRTEASVTKFIWPKYFKIGEKTDSVFNKVALNYDRNPTTDEWKIAEATNNNIEQKYNIKNKVLEIDSYLTDATEAGNAASFYASLVKEPLEKVELRGDLETLDYMPTDKITVERNIVADRKAITALEETVYQIIQIRKSIDKGVANIVALKDSQAQGSASHADIPHIDSYTDSYTDTYDDTAHTDTPHTNTHGDWEHSDHTDVPYDDTPHEDHDDLAHHEDVPHFDSPHNNSYSDAHMDEHTDIAHVDISHIDSPYADHGDEHSDEAHVDSEI